MSILGHPGIYDPNLLGKSLSDHIICPNDENPAHFQPLGLIIFKPALQNSVLFLLQLVAVVTRVHEGVFSGQALN